MFYVDRNVQKHLTDLPMGTLKKQRKAEIGRKMVHQLSKRPGVAEIRKQTIFSV